MGVMKGAISGVGLQLQDVAVQLQSGTSPFTIIAQQLPQAASAFGPLGIAIGTTVAILAVAAGAFFNFRTQAITSADIMANALSSPFIAGVSAADEYIKKIKDASTEQRQFLVQINQAARDVAVKEVDTLAGKIPFGSVRSRLFTSALRQPQSPIGENQTGALNPATAAGVLAQQNTKTLITNMIDAAKRGDPDAVSRIAMSAGLVSDPETSIPIQELIKQASSIALNNAVINLDTAALKGMAPKSTSKFDSARDSLQARLAGATDKSDGILAQAINSAGGRDNLLPEQIAELEKLAVAIEKAEEAKRSSAGASNALAREEEQAARIIEELQRRLGKFTDTRAAFIARYVNQIEAAIDPAKLAEIKKLAGELFHLDNQARSTQETLAMRNRERAEGERIFGGLSRDRQQRISDWQSNPSAMAGASRGLMDIARAAADVGAQVQQSIVGAFTQAEDALVSFVTTGKLEFKSLVDSILQDIARMAVRQAVTGPLAGFLGGFFPMGPGVAHAGGVAGSLPRYHGGGMASDEFPAILQRGERVVSRTENRWGGGGGTPIMVSIDARGASDPAMIARIAREQARRGVVEGLDQQSRRRRGRGMLQS